MKLKTANANWNITGINLISSDSIYQKLVTAIESGNLDPKFLQKEIGHNAPILVNEAAHDIQFCQL